MSEVESITEHQNQFSDLKSSPEASLDSYRPIHSLLLCPSQWTALLESPVSLVRQDCLEEITEDEELFLDEDDCTKSKHLLHISIQDISPVQQTNEKETIMGGILSLTQIDNTDSQNELSSSSEKCEREVNQTPAHLLPQPNITSYCQVSSEGTCTVGSSGDEVQRGNETPSPPDQRQSVPSTPIFENRLFPSHFTHTRNISETPSLPPFISSSSSSAYHSRNSSLTSQITSECFDSDSQFTDIDSCIVPYKNDFHRPISLQEARFKFPELTSMEVSMQRQWFSDLNMTTPIRVPEHLFVPSPPLEETLRMGEEPQRASPNESFEEKHLAAALKSSEWIKREMRRARQTMIQVKVSSRSRHVVHFNVKAGDMFLWEFATKRKDIAFGLSFEPTEVATQQDIEEERTDVKMMPILPILRVNTHTHPIIGSHTATQDGVYEILFDNSYSRFFAKELYYRITTKPLIPNEHYLDQ